MSIADNLKTAFHVHEPEIRAIADSIPAFVALVDRDHRYRFNNDQYRALVRRRMEEIEGHHIAEVLGPEAYARIKPGLEAALSGSAAHFTTVLPRRGGGTWTARATYVPLPNVSDPLGVLVFVVDESARSEAEEALRRSEANYRALVEDLPLGIFRLGPAGGLQSANRALAEMLGFGDSAELLELGRDELEALAPMGWEGLTTEPGNVEPIASRKLEWRTLDGEPILVSLSGRLIRGESGLEGFAGVVEDVTEKHRLEGLLRQAQKMEAVGQLTGGIAHDFNNILTIILGNAELLGMATEDEDAIDRHDSLFDITAAALRGKTLIEKLLGFSRQAPLELKALDLAELLRSLGTLLRRLLPETVSMEIDTNQPALVWGDARAIEQMVFNLATNARDAMSGSGSLRLSVIRRDDLSASDGGGEGDVFSCLRVEDDGAGMDENTLRRAFEPFFTTKSSGAGTGLGLAMVYGLVQQHGGRLEVRSAPGSGTTVDLCFPALTSGPATTTLDATPVAPWTAAAPTSRGERTILVVEDDDDVRATLRDTLAAAGYRVVMASDGEEALRVLAERQPRIELVVSDLVMPKLCGLELYSALRSLDPHLPILFVSGYPDRATRDCSGLPPGVPLVSKPWRSQHLLEEIRQLLDPSGPAAPAGLDLEQYG